MLYGYVAGLAVLIYLMLDWLVIGTWSADLMDDFFFVPAIAAAFAGRISLLKSKKMVWKLLGVGFGLVAGFAAVAGLDRLIR